MTLFCALVGGIGAVSEAYDYSLLPPMNGLPSDFAERRAGKDVNASIQIGVASEGIYQVTFSSLTNAGVAATNLVGSMMRLYCRTQEVAIYVSSTNQWTAADYFLFPGDGFDGYYSRTNVYWLGFGAGGKRMASRSAVPFSGGSRVTSYRKTVLHHVDRNFRDLYRWDDTTLDHWFDIYLTNTAIQTSSLMTDHVLTNDSASLDVVLCGYSDNPAIAPDHCTSIKVNNNTIGLFQYDGLTTLAATSNFPATWLVASNTVAFQPILTNGVTGDASWVERFAVTYSRALLLESNVLFFTGSTGSNTYQVGGFTVATNILAFDVTDSASAVILTGLVVTNTGGGTNAIVFGDNTAVASRYAVCQQAGIDSIGFVQRAVIRGLAETNQQADYVVICPYAFRQQVYRLLVLRRLQGLSVSVAPLPDIYNEFSYGIADAAAIKQYIGYAFHHWASPSKYVVLAGTGNHDPLGLEAGHTNHSPDIIPVHLGPGNQLWSSLDGWYAGVSEDDNVPDLALGRIPVETVAELKNVVDKIVALEGAGSNSAWRSYAAVAADKNDTGYDFTGASDVLFSKFMANGFPIPFQLYQDAGDGSNDVVAEISKGLFYLNYYGHGNVTDWADTPRFFTTNDIGRLTNTNYPVISMMTCENGDFSGVGLKCLVEAFLEPANRGASACVASSSLATLQGAEVFINKFYDTLIVERKQRIGDALLPAYSALFLWSRSDRAVLYYELFGDPAMIVNP